MSTIASPREPSLSGRRIPLLSTPTSSSRPSLDTPRGEASPSRPPLPPNPSSSTLPSQPSQPKRNRAALREYYNLQKASAAAPGTGPASSLSTTSQAPSSPASSSIHSFPDDYGTGNGNGDDADCEMDKEDFDAEEYVRRVLGEKSLGEVLAIYRGVLSDVRALDAERKALVYDNYSKLIVATEMIGRMREGVGENAGVGGGGVVGDRKRGDVVDGVEELVERVRRGVEGLRREGIGEGGGGGVSKEEIERAERKRRTRSVAERVLGTPEKVRSLVKEGKADEAKMLWDKEKRLLERWRERGVGGPDVAECIEDGERALRGEEAVVRGESKP